MNIFGTQQQLEHTILIIQAKMASLTLELSKLAELNREGAKSEEIDESRTKIADAASLVAEMSLELIAPSDA